MLAQTILEYLNKQIPTFLSDSDDYIISNRTKNYHVYYIGIKGITPDDFIAQFYGGFDSEYKYLIDVNDPEFLSKLDTIVQEIKCQFSKYKV